MMRLILFVFGIAFVCSSCNHTFFTVTATIETEPVQSAGDAADDPAIFVHPFNPTWNAIIATDKQKGLLVYDVKGKLKNDYAFGKINNVDVKQGFPFDGKNIVLVGGSNRTNNSIVLYEYEPNTFSIKELPSDTLLSKTDEVYGFCFAKNNDAFFAFVVGKNGVVEQWLIEANGKRLTAKIVRSIDLGGQCEGMVADEALGYLFVAEELKGIWKLPLDPSDKAMPSLVVDLKKNRALKADLEGLAIYQAPNDKGYLIASSQGNYTYAVFERSGTHQYLGSFKVIDGTIDGSDETDGLEVTPLPLSTDFPYGCLIVQDGKNKNGNIAVNQNFKLIGWENIAKTFVPNLLISEAGKK